jgi:hypothetical protein
MTGKSIGMLALTAVLLSYVLMVGPGAPSLVQASGQIAPASQQVGSQMGTVTAGRLNVRTGPGITNRVIGQLRQGERVEIVDRQSGWLKVAYPAAAEGVGWVSGAYVQVDGAAASAPRTVTAASTGSGKLVFQSRNGGDIYIVNGDGSGLRKLTSGFEPALSPDGSQVAFTRFTEPAGLYLIGADGSNERIVFGADRPRSATWAPDGQSIIFERTQRSDSCYSLPFGCLTLQEWAALSGGADCIALGGSQICIGDYPRFTLYFTNLTNYDLATGAIRDLPATMTALAPDRHPQDTRVLYLDKEGLFTTRAEGNDPPQQVVNLPNLVGPAVYSPDGRTIYGMRRLHDHWDVWRWNEDGSGATALTSQPALSPKPINNVAPSVSPDGRQVVFLTDRNGKWEMYVMNSDGSNQRPFAPQALAGITFVYDSNADRMVDWGK